MPNNINKFPIGKHLLLLSINDKGLYSLHYEGQLNPIQHQCSEKEVFNILEEELRAAARLSEMEMQVYLQIKSGCQKTTEIADRLKKSVNYIESIRTRIGRKQII